MPRKSRSDHEIAAIKKDILDTALELIIQEGFQRLSMRKLASRLGMTATTIYNYYSSKDEINLMIRMHGFELLYQTFEKCYTVHSDPLTRLRAMIRSYFEFGVQYPDYYDIMFNLRTPKYLDYADTDLEPVARTEKEASLRNYAITEKAMTELNDQYRLGSPEQVALKTIQLWCDVHGIISLYNSHLFDEINPDPSGLTERLIEDVIARTCDGAAAPAEEG